MQPIAIAADGCTRFSENRIVSRLLTVAQEHGYGLHEIAIAIAAAEGKFEQAEVEQLTQLIGYSVSGFCDLSTSKGYSKRAAWAKAQRLISKKDEPPARSSCNGCAGAGFEGRFQCAGCTDFSKWEKAASCSP